MNGKLKTKIIAVTLALIIGIFLSIGLAWILLQIFLKQPENILQFTPINTLEIFEIEEGKQIFYLILLCFILLIVFSVFKVFNLNNYLSKTYKVTKEIRIPIPVGKEQTQQGSSWWLNKKEFKNVFGINTFDPENRTIKHLLETAKKERKREKYLIEHQEEIIPGANEVSEIVPTIFKTGGLVVGKKDKYKYRIRIKMFKKIIPYISISKKKVEQIYYLKDDMHSLTVGATRSGKTRCLVLQTIDNTALAGENMILSDPKGELYEYTSQNLKSLRI